MQPNKDRWRFYCKVDYDELKKRSPEEYQRLRTKFNTDNHDLWPNPGCGAKFVPWKRGSSKVINIQVENAWHIILCYNIIQKLRALRLAHLGGLEAGRLDGLNFLSRTPGKHLQNSPKRLPTSSQQHSERVQEHPPQEASRAGQEAPRAPHNRKSSSFWASPVLQVIPKTTQDTPKKLPRDHQEATKRPQEIPRGTQEDP